MKMLLKHFLRTFNLKLSRIQTPGSHLRPIGDLLSTLEDVKARGLKCRVVLDIGASDGSWSRYAKTVFKDAKYVLMEPRPICHPALDRFAREFPDTMIIKAGAASKAGTLTLTDWDTASTFLGVEDATAEKHSLPTVTVNSLFPDSELPDLVKLDVEGFELEVLEGASRLFRMTELFIIEVALDPFSSPRPTAPDVINFMRERDYHLYDIAGFIRRPYDGALALLDLCFARGGGLLRAESHKWHAEP
jgi:FkbM family methyltransferase